MIYFQSGLLSVYETSSDTKDLLAQVIEDTQVAEAVGLYCCQVKKWIGTFTAAPGKLQQDYSPDNLKSRAYLAGVSIYLKVIGRW
jgi:hypothetical protein